MQNQDNLLGPPDPRNGIQVASGYKSATGQFTAIFTVVALILSAVGYHYSATQVENWFTMINNLLTTIGPMLAIIPVLMTYINSRGKIASNAINATAQIVAPPVITPPPITGELISATAAPVDFAGLGSFKDPRTYADIVHIAGELGVPGAAQADAIQQKVPVAELITGILGMLHKKTK
jgi:hypothetical protein